MNVFEQMVQELELEKRTIDEISKMRPIAFRLLSWRGTPESETISRGKLAKALRSGSLRKVLPEGIAQLDAGLRASLRKLEEHQQIKTVFEREWKARLDSFLKDFVISACWIGPFCTDLFVPNIRGDWKKGGAQSSWGLIVEVDGWIHFKEPKQKKDNLREEYFAGLGIPILRVENRETFEARLSGLFPGFDEMKSLDSLRRRRLIHRVQLETVLAWASEEALNALFGSDFVALSQGGGLKKKDRECFFPPERVLV